jgi:hypothetical protein
MNAPLPDTIRKALESVTLDDSPRRGLRHSQRYAVGCEAAHAGFVVERVRAMEH